MSFRTDSQRLSSIIVCVDENTDINNVAKDLVENGMVVIDIHSITKIITGTCNKADRAKIESVNGVLSVEDDQINYTQI
jgi:hypothetical protein